MKACHALRIPILAAALAAGLVACTGAGSTPAATTPTSGAESGAGVGSLSRGAVAVDPAAQPAVDTAVTAFAQEAGLAEADVTVVEVSPVTWPDSSLGCPQPGQSYLQVLSPGYRVVLEGGGERAVYHTSDGSMGAVQVIRCDGGDRRQLNLAGLSAPGLERARLDLTERLADEGATISLLASGVAPVTSLVCPGTPEPTIPGAPGMVVFEFQLQAGEETYLYRAAGERILYCGPYRPSPVDAQGNPTE